MSQSNQSNRDTVFAGSIPQVYEQYMVPLFFEHYAVDLATRVAEQHPHRVIELAAGTGVVTRKLAQRLPPATEIVATDLSQEMLNTAATLMSRNGASPRPIEWRPANAMQLPFPDASFDVVVCQFGVMFFPDKAKAFAEARRVLRAGGQFIFNVWDSLAHNEFAETVQQSLEIVFPQQPPQFMGRIPHGYFDIPTITRDLAQGGFSAPLFTTLAARSRANSAAIPAIAICQGTPLRSEIETRAPNRLAEATEIATDTLTKRFGSGEVDGKMQAHIVVCQ